MVNLENLSPQAPVSSLEELSVLSLDAAIELDQLRSGGNLRKEVVDALTKCIGLRADGAGAADVLKRLIDPATVNIYNRAVTQLTKVTTSTIDELAAEMRKYVEAFSRDIKLAGPDDVIAMRDFCLALHREILAELYDRYAETVSDAA